MLGLGAHDPERDAAAYVGGELSSRERRRFEAHLLGCEACWREVQLDHEGRRRATGLRELAPAGLREDVRAAITFSGGSTPYRRRGVLLGAVAALALVATAAISLSVLDRGAPREPAAISAALATVRADQVPGGIPQRGAPDLGPAGLRLVDAGHGSLEDLGADVFAYRDAEGDLLYVFMSASPFPTASGAAETSGMTGGWSARASGLLMVCRSQPHSYLLVGRDVALVQSVDAIMSGR
jgi:Putative zinc-finger